MMHGGYRDLESTAGTFEYNLASLLHYVRTKNPISSNSEETPPRIQLMHLAETLNGMAL